MSSIPNESVALILVDPPYGSTKCKWDEVIPMEKLWAQYERVLSPNGTVVIFGQEPFSSIVRTSRLNLYKYDLVWEKGEATGHLNAKRAPLRAHENIMVFQRKGAIYNPQKTTGHERKVSRRIDDTTSVYNKQSKATFYDSTERYPRSVMFFSKDKQKTGTLHPTQKPLALIEYLVKTYSNEDDVVLDSCLGSGTTGVAAKKLGRRFIGIELDAGYFAVAQNRILEEGVTDVDTPKKAA